MYHSSLGPGWSHYNKYRSEATKGCPDQLWHLWNVKKDAYVESGHWELKPVRSAVPMLLLTKPGKPGELTKLQTIVDLYGGDPMQLGKSKYRSSIDLLDAYEQIRVKLGHVEHTAMNTLSRTMNLLDNLFIYMEDLESHVEAVMTTIDILEVEKFYVNPRKMQLLKEVLLALGWVVSNEGICMDLDKVDNLAKWKMPTNKELLHGFLGSAGSLADNIE
ncbi:DNA/RNA polymerase [Macrolepiota fuliginosa MF-IS2]|uniref:DNA/RNA polymerase n=1 Tax=Macrolepiota fuliginosa MF-IS2 TaxID=1400762 RepID=A0A9P5WYP0_9AGAR|nr:DNA/RNA polymerase [Macrolepiota fuliginosa MF-IS2]